MAMPNNITIHALRMHYAMLFQGCGYDCGRITWFTSFFEEKLLLVQNPVLVFTYNYC